MADGDLEDLDDLDGRWSAPTAEVKPLLSNTAFELRRGRRYGNVSLTYLDIS